MYEERVYFTVLKFKSDHNPENIRKKLRSTDIIYYDAKTKQYILCLINIRKMNIDPVLNKLFETKPDILIIESTQWNEKKEEICK
jgi:hypothetical protein